MSLPVPLQTCGFGASLGDFYINGTNKNTFYNDNIKRILGDLIYNKFGRCHKINLKKLNKDIRYLKGIKC